MLLHYFISFALISFVGAATIQPRSRVTAPSPAPVQRLVTYDKTTSWSLLRRLWNVIFASDLNTARVEDHGNAPNHHLLRYQNDIVLRFNISSSDEARSMAEAVNSLYLDVWSTTKEHVDVRLPHGTVCLYA